MTVAFDAAGVEVVRESVSQDVTDFSALVSRIDDDVDVVVLPWQVAANGQLFADQMAEQGKTAQLIGSDGLFTDEFSAEGAYLTSFAPDITGIDDAEIQALIEQFNADGRGDLGTFGPPTYAAANALTVAMDSVCQAGGELTRESVLDAVRALNIEKSILGSPLAFNDAGDVDGAAFYIFQNQGGAKVLLSGAPAGAAAESSAGGVPEGMPTAYTGTSSLVSPGATIALRAALSAQDGTSAELTFDVPNAREEGGSVECGGATQEGAFTQDSSAVTGGEISIDGWGTATVELTGTRSVYGSVTTPPSCEENDGTWTGTAGELAGRSGTIHRLRDGGAETVTLS